MPIKAKKDMLVYKRLHISPISKEIVTPFTNHLVTLGSTFVTEEPDINVSDEMQLLQNNKPLYIITKGFIHCYTKVDDAVCQLGRLDIVVKCTIKKGTLYYKSFSGLQICAKSIEVSNEVIAYRDLNYVMHSSINGTTTV